MFHMEQLKSKAMSDVKGKARQKLADKQANQNTVNK